MRARRQDKGKCTGLPWADRQHRLHRRHGREGSLSVACLLLSLVLLVPAVGCHSTGPNDGAFEPGPEPTALLVFLPERLTLGNTETRYGETACLWPVPTRTAPAPLPLAVVVVTPALPLPRGTSPFPLRV